MSVIAEFKRRSPAAGDLPRGSDPVEDIVRAYERGGAAALSILTEGEYFGGSIADLRAARATTDLPILRKDFTLDRYQLYEAAAVQADAVLLIVAVLERDELEQLHAEAGELDLDCLVEVHDAEELETALEIDADVIGINNRNLSDFTVDVGTTFELLSDVPAGKTVVSESGIRSRAADRGPGAGRGRCGAGGGDADVGRGPGGGVPRAGRGGGADHRLSAQGLAPVYRVLMRSLSRLQLFLSRAVRTETYVDLPSSSTRLRARSRTRRATLWSPGSSAAWSCW